MAQKKYFRARGIPSFSADEISVRLILSEDRLPLFLKGEILSFAQRNSLAEVRNSPTVHECCPRCLKAHLLKKARKPGEEKTIKIIANILPCEAGHDGYYINKEELIRI